MLPAPKPVAAPAKQTPRAPKNMGEVASLGAGVQWASSPARAMQDQLAQRLNPETELGRPSPLARLIVILGASALLWAMIGTAIMAVLG